MKKFIASFCFLLCTILFLWSMPSKAQSSEKFPYPITDGHITLILPCGPTTKILPYLASSLGEKIEFQKDHEDVDIRFVFLENKETKTWTLLAMSTVTDSSCIFSYNIVKSNLGVKYPINFLTTTKK